MNKTTKELMELAASISPKTAAKKTERFVCYLYKVDNLVNSDIRKKIKDLEEELVNMQMNRQALSIERITQIMEMKKELLKEGERTEYIFRLERTIPLVDGTTPIRGSGGKITYTKKKNVTEIHVDEKYLEKGLATMTYCDEEGKISDVMVMRKTEKGTDSALVLLETNLLNVEVSKDYFNAVTGKLVIPSKVYLSLVTGDMMSSIGTIAAVKERADREYNHYSNM